MKRWAVAFLMVPCAICMAAAGDYPTRPIRMIVPFSPAARPICWRA